jgi:hypothetical protein
MPAASRLEGLSTTRPEVLLLVRLCGVGFQAGVPIDQAVQLWRGSLRCSRGVVPAERSGDWDRCRRRRGPERLHFVAVAGDHAPGGLGYLVPDARYVAKGFGDDQPRVV